MEVGACGTESPPGNLYQVRTQCQNWEGEATRKGIVSYRKNLKWKKLSSLGPKKLHIPECSAYILHFIAILGMRTQVSPSTALNPRVSGGKWAEWPRFTSGQHLALESSENTGVTAERNRETLFFTWKSGGCTGIRCLLSCSVQLCRKENTLRLYCSCKPNTAWQTPQVSQKVMKLGATTEQTFFLTLWDI